MNETKTIPEFLAEHPDVDVRPIWERCFGILTDLLADVRSTFAVEPHHSSADYGSWVAPTGGWKGSLNTFTGPEAEWVVHSWIGDPEHSILDMNLQVWLGPHVDVPHLVLVFGTIPKVFHYSDYVPRRDLAMDLDYVGRYYDAANEPYLALRGDERFTWSVSHGTYMRAINSPVAHSYVAEPTDDVLDTLEERVRERFATWLGWVRAAEPVPEGQRAELSRRDHALRRQIYENDPMNALGRKFLGDDLAGRLIAARFGEAQIAENEAGSER